MTVATIAAIATSPGNGAIGVVRISGPRSLSILKDIAPRFQQQTPEPRRAYFVRLQNHLGHVLDEALALWFPAPNSFTGDDIVELQCHGGTWTLQGVLHACLQSGARPAEAGEFSRRALINGKLDLLQVEAIADVIHARSESAHRTAQSHLAGQLSKEIFALQEQLVHLMILVEAAIDFSLEEHVFTISHTSILERLHPIQQGICTLLGTWDTGRMRMDGIRVAIVGHPNAGKSSLLNWLAGHERALVTDIAGTTRDYIEEQIQVNGLQFVLVDTAGIRETGDTVEALGVRRSQEQAERADAIWLLVDARAPSQSNALIQSLPQRPMTVLLTMVDLVESTVDISDLCLPSGTPTHCLSLKTGEGTDALHSLLLETAQRAGLRTDDDSAIITRARHREVLLRAQQALERATEAATDHRDHELVALDLRMSLDALGEMVGAVTADDVLNRIFDGFCIGK
jgi:tRNA modification GTPase